MNVLIASLFYTVHNCRGTDNVRRRVDILSNKREMIYLFMVCGIG